AARKTVRGGYDGSSASRTGPGGIMPSGRRRPTSSPPPLDFPASQPPPRCPCGRSGSRSFLLSDSHSRRSPPRRSPPGRRLKSACFCSIPKRSAFQQRARNVVEGLRELGWIDGQNIALRFKFAALNEARLDPLAEELVREKVDLIVAVASAP